MANRPHVTDVLDQYMYILNNEVNENLINLVVTSIHKAVIILLPITTTINFLHECMDVSKK